MKRLALFLVVLLSWGIVSAETVPEYEMLQGPQLTFFQKQYHDAYRLIASLRHPVTGQYRDAYVLAGQDTNPSSVAATGVGLIALAIADQEGWEREAEILVEETLRFINGLEPGFIPDREKQTGFFRHWINPATGARAWNSEYSTIDTALLVKGALFAADYFSNNALIGELARKLYYSIQWESAIANPETGELYMIIGEDGQGKAPTKPFNEYVILADLARLDPDNLLARGMWEKVFSPEKLDFLPQIDYFGYKLLSDGTMLSSFIPQFVFYLVPEYGINLAYREYFSQAQQADKYDWNRRKGMPSFVWGHGAGTEGGLGGSYAANAIGRNLYGVVSPYIIAGFLPVYPGGIDDLYQIYLEFLPYDVYENEKDKGDARRFRSAYQYGLKRFAPEWPKWYANHMSVIDWSSMLYGLTAFKYGIDFFHGRDFQLPSN